MQLARVETVAAEAKSEAERNRTHFDAKLEEVKSAEAATHLELREHRAEFKGLRSGIGIGLTVLGFVLTVGLTIIGWMVAHG